VGRLIEIDGAGSADKVSRRIVAVLQEKELATR